MTPDWILAVGTLVFAFTTWATLSFGYAYFRELGRRDELAAQRETAPVPDLEPEPTTPARTLEPR